MIISKKQLDTLRFMDENEVIFCGSPSDARKAYNEREDLQTYTREELEMLRLMTFARMNRPGNNPNSVSPSNNDDRTTLKIISDILEGRK